MGLRDKILNATLWITEEKGTFSTKKTDYTLAGSKPRRTRRKER